MPIRTLGISFALCRCIRPVPLGAVAALLLLGASTCCRAGIDHMLSYDNSGIWKRNYQEFLEYGLITAEVGGAVWEGGETRLGRTFWTSIDSSVAAGLVAQVMRTIPACMRWNCCPSTTESHA